MGHGARSYYRKVSCKGKVRHDDMEQALVALDNSLPNGKIECMGPYHCEFCRGWHVGHARRETARANFDALAEYEPKCGCGHGADSHEDATVPYGRCAYCYCMTSRQYLYRAHIRGVQRRRRLLEALLKAACSLYPRALKAILRDHLAGVAKMQRLPNDGSPTPRTLGDSDHGPQNQVK